MNYTVTVIGYLVLVSLGFTLWAFSKFKPDAVAPLAKLIDRMMSRRRTRLAVVAIWWWLGWHFLANVPLPNLFA